MPEDTAFIGTLSLNGDIHSADGMLPAILAAQSLGYKTVYLPHDESTLYI
ncbi:magnesium chelatase domain-containing protein [Bacillus sp. N9]